MVLRYFEGDMKRRDDFLSLENGVTDSRKPTGTQHVMGKPGIKAIFLFLFGNTPYSSFHIQREKRN